MALTVQASGTQTAVIGTEHTLNAASFTTLGLYLLSTNLVNMAAADVVELRCYVKVLTGDAQEYLVYSASYAGVQGDGAAGGSSAKGDVVKESIPVPSPYSIRWTLKQTAGVGRNFPWRVDTL